MTSIQNDRAPRTSVVRRGWSGLLAATVLGLGAMAQDESTSWTLSADVIYPVLGDAIRGGSVVVADGKITAVTPGEAGGDLHVAAITPGLVDLSARMGLGLDAVEQSREVTADMRVADSIDIFSVAWDRQVRQGVTTALVNPPDRNVIGGYGVLMKTAGSHDVAERTVKADAVMRGAIGTEPSGGNHPAFGRPTDFYSRRPTTRMGVEWELRSQFFEAFYAKGDDDREFDGSADLRKVLGGDVPLMLQTWATQDIRTAVFFTEEARREGLGSIKLIVDSAAEAWREPQLLVRSGAAVVLPPFPPQGRTRDQAFLPIGAAKELIDLGIPVALSSHGAADAESRLDRQAGLAMRGGMTRAEALEAVTLTPARMMGVEDRVGSIRVGRDADLVLWNGEPFELTSRIVGVLVDGKLVLDPRGGK